MDGTDKDLIMIELSKWKLALIVAAALAFVALGVWMLGLENKAVHGSQFDDPEAVVFLAWLSIVFFGICGIFGLKKMISNRPGVVLTPQGFWDNSSGVAPGIVPWSDVSGISEYQMQSQRFVSVMLKDPEEYVNRGNTLKRMANRANLKLCGTPINISSNSLKISYDDLLELFQECYAMSRKGSDQKGNGENVEVV